MNFAPGAGVLLSFVVAASAIMQPLKRLLRTGTACLLLAIPAAYAAITTDGTLGPAQSLTGPDFRIDQSLGTLKGANLFHSFHTFDIQAGQSASFTATAPVDHVISRVTGGALSTIDGLLRSEIAGADFWLLNPAGILFGPNAVLDLPASLHLSTADELRLADGGLFSAAAPAASRLTVAPPAAFGFLGGDTASVQMEGANLELTPGSGLNLVAGDIGLNAASLWIDQGWLRAIAVGEQAVEVPVANAGDLAASGAVVLLDSGVYLGGDGGGDLEIRGGQVMLVESHIYNANQGSASPRGGSLVRADSLEMVSGSINNNALAEGASGPLTVDVAGDLLLDVGAKLRSATGGPGAAGDLTVRAGSLSLFHGGNIVSHTQGLGPTGKIRVEAGELRVDGEDSGFDTGITNFSQWGGPTGLIRVEVAGEARIINGGMVANTTFGGDAGDIEIEAGRLTVDGAGSSFITGIVSQSHSATGDAGDLRIWVEEDFSVLNGAGVASSTFADGDAGTVVIDTGSLRVDGQGSPWYTGISSQANTGGSGKGGSVTVHAADGVELLDGGTISSSTFAAGTAGTVRVEAGSLTLDGRGSALTTGITSQASIGSSGDAGGIEVVVDGRLDLLDGATISSSTFASGKAGSVYVEAGEVVIDRRGSPGITGLFSVSFDPEQGGDAGAVELHATGDIRILQGSEVSSSTRSPGAGGTVTVTARNLTVDGSGSDLFTGINSQATAGSRGDAGLVRVDVDEGLQLLGGGEISSSTYGAGDAGGVEIAGRDLRIDGSAAPEYFTGISSRAGTGSAGAAGHITLRLEGVLEVRDGGGISTSTYAQGDAGSIDIEAASVHLDGADQGHPTYIFSQAEPGSRGKGGSVSLRISGDLVVERGAQISSGTFSSGPSGSVAIEADRLLLLGSTGPMATLVTSQNAPGASGGAGQVAIVVRRIEVLAGAQLSSATFSAGDAGTVRVEAGSILLSGMNSAIASLATDEGGEPQVGGVGEVILKAGEIRIEQGASISIAAQGQVRPDAPEGQAIRIEAQRLILEGDGVITAKSTHNAPAADITIAVGDELLLLEGSQITTLANQADGGEIHIQGGALLVSDSLITTSVEGTQGNGGDIVLNLSGMAMDSGFIQANTAAAGASGGDIRVETPALVVPGGQRYIQGGDERLVFVPNSGLNVIQAAAPDGVSGEISLSTPQLDLENGAAAIEARITRPVELRRDPCQVAAGEIPSSLSTAGHGGLPTDVGSALAVPIRGEAAETGGTPSASLPKGRFGCREPSWTFGWLD